MPIPELITDKGELTMNQSWADVVPMGHVHDCGRGREGSRKQNKFGILLGEGNSYYAGNYQYLTKLDSFLNFVINNKYDNNTYYLSSICCDQALC